MEKINNNIIDLFQKQAPQQNVWFGILYMDYY